MVMMSFSFNPLMSFHYFNLGDATLFIFLYLREFCLNNYYYKYCKKIYVNKIVRDRKAGRVGKRGGVGGGEGARERGGRGGIEGGRE